MGYRLLADLVVVSHVGYLVFLTTGSLLAWRWPKVLWVHVPSVAWALASVTVRIECPLTALEQALRRRTGGHVYRGGFIKHYITGHLYPTRFAPAVGTLIAAAVAAGYVGLWRQMQRQRELVS